MYLGALNEIQDYCGNNFLHGITYEKYYVIEGPEFGKSKGQTVLIGSLYGLRIFLPGVTILIRNTTRMGINLTKANADIRIKDCGTHYKFHCLPM